MQLDFLNDSASHLGYCTNIHPGENWQALFPVLQHHVPQIKERVSPNQPFGLGLRASMQTITGLQDPLAMNKFKQWLADEDVYVFTINGFPYGAFHGTPVKANVYKPDWSDKHRLNYTCAIADVLAQLSPPDNFGSISTVPGTFQDWATPDIRARISDNLISCVAHCLNVKRRTGVTIAVALEPEPACLLETVDDVLSFFNADVYCRAAIQTLARRAGISHSEADNALHTHLGVCYDICHAAVEFEDPLQGIERMQSAGIPIIKLQLSSALKLTRVNATTLNALKRFDEPVYLHQVVERQSRTLTRFDDLPQAIQAHETARHIDAQDKQWRVHFHVPVFLPSLEQFDTTQQELCKVLVAHALSPIAPHLEVETYTWDVLPEHYRNVPVGTAIARELDWVVDCLKLPAPLVDVA